MRRNTTRCAFPFRHYIFANNRICPPANRLYLKELLNILQAVSSCSRYTTFILFGSHFHRQNLPISKRTLPSDLCTNLSLNADVWENRLPFVSQSINNFSDYDISHSHDWECPSLSPHVLLVMNYLNVNKDEGKIILELYVHFDSAFTM